MSTVKWYVGAPRKLWFTLGALGATDVVFLDTLPPTPNAPVAPLQATINNRATGECYVTMTPAVAGVHRLWPRIVDGNGTIINIGQAVTRTVWTPGT